MTDAELLQEYVRTNSQESFAELVRRHIDWVHSAAWRQVRDQHLADDVTQAVFIALAQQSRRLQNSPSLSPWLFQVMRYAALNAIRAEFRRRRHETEAAAMNPTCTADQQWEQLSPMLEQLVARLGSTDRHAVLLRFYQRMNFAQVGSALGLSEEAARKRVNRAVEKLRTAMAGRGVTVPAAGLATMLLSSVTTTADTQLAGAIAANLSAPGLAMQIFRQAIWSMTLAKLKIAAAVLLVLLPVAAAPVVLQTMAQKPPPPAMVADVSATTAPADGNAAELYRRAFEVLDRFPADRDEVGNWDTMPLERAAEVLSRLQPGLELVHAAAAKSSADWKMEYTTDGMGRMLPELNKIRTLGHLTMLHARYVLEEKRDAEAAADIAAVVAMARHLSAEPILVFRLVSTGITQIAVEFTDGNLSQLSPQAAKMLLERIDRLPPMASMADTFRAEKKYGIAQLRQQTGGIIWQDSMTQFYDQLIAALELPPDQQDAAIEQVKTRFALNQMAKIVLPSLVRAVENDRKSQAKFAGLVDQLRRSALH